MGQATPLLGFQVTPIKQYLKLDGTQLGKSACSPPENVDLPRRTASAQQSVAGKRERKSTRKKRRTGQKKTVNLSINDLE